MRILLIRLSVMFVLSIFVNNLFSQPELLITKLKEKNQNLIITYDILNYNQEDLFNVYVEIITSSGDILRPNHVKGDINKKLAGDTDYQIIWNLAADNIFINEDIDIQIGADMSIDLSYFKYSSLMLSSTLMPGIGLKKIERKNPYLILGTLGYVGIGASVYFYIQGQKSFTDYEVEKDPVVRDEFYDQANKNNQNAKIAGISAAGIWLINYLWFTTKWSKKKNETASVFNRNFGFYANYHPVLKKPMFTLAYQF